MSKQISLRFCNKHKRLEGRHKGKSITFLTLQEAKDYALSEGIDIAVSEEDKVDLLHARTGRMRSREEYVNPANRDQGGC